MVLWLVDSACVAGVHTPAKPAVGGMLLVQCCYKHVLNCQGNELSNRSMIVWNGHAIADTGDGESFILVWYHKASLSCQSDGDSWDSKHQQRLNQPRCAPGAPPSTARSAKLRSQAQKPSARSAMLLVNSLSARMLVAACAKDSSIFAVYATCCLNKASRSTCDAVRCSCAISALSFASSSFRACSTAAACEHEGDVHQSVSLADPLSPLSNVRTTQAGGHSPRIMLRPRT